jgi:hypothetical protein
MRVFKQPVTLGYNGATVALILVALAFAVVGHAKWSSEAAFGKFLNASKPSQSDSSE